MSVDPYVDPVTRVLRNSLGIGRTEELAAAERELTMAALYRVERRPIPGRYDLDHLCSFHREIFRHVYPWAGEIRTVAIARTDLFALPQHIVSYSARTFDGLAAERYLGGLDFDAFVERLAHYYGEVNAVHPFREGNGRTQRAFFLQLATEAGWYLAWTRMDPGVNVAASAASLRGDGEPLKAMFAGLVTPLAADSLSGSDET
jgi:cell filamentation protein